MAEHSAEDNPNKYGRRVYGRRQGRPLNDSRRKSLESLLPALSVPPETLTGAADIDPLALFDAGKKDVWMEIGFGNGEHLALLCQENPDIGFLGAEPFINGMAALLKTIGDNPHNNIRVLMDDALLLANSLKDASIGRLYILNPDPWPKKRHHKRRMINKDNLGVFARILKPGGQMFLATDVEDLALWMFEHSTAHPEFKTEAPNLEECRLPPPGWLITTRYAQKGLDAGRRQSYMVFTRK